LLPSVVLWLVFLVTGGRLTRARDPPGSCTRRTPNSKLFLSWASLSSHGSRCFALSFFLRGPSPFFPLSLTRHPQIPHNSGFEKSAVSHFLSYYIFIFFFSGSLVCEGTSSVLREILLTFLHRRQPAVFYKYCGCVCCCVHVYPALMTGSFLRFKPLAVPRLLGLFFPRLSLFLFSTNP